jgi:hypothetical protein
MLVCTYTCREPSNIALPIRLSLSLSLALVSKQLENRCKYFMKFHIGKLFWICILIIILYKADSNNEHFTFEGFWEQLERNSLNIHQNEKCFE